MTFEGYRRADGRVGVRNHVVVMPGVLCAESAARRIALETGAVYLGNPYGCGQSGADTQRTLCILSGLLASPNVYGALIVGLGCEFLNEGLYREAVEARSAGKDIRYVSIQAEGGINAVVRKGRQEVEELLAGAAGCVRTTCDLSELVIGVECGGSDPTSGISSNVVLGEISDRLSDAGGASVISETAEAIGAEHILREHGATPEIGQAIFDSIRAREAAYLSFGEDIRKSNPSPGNIRGGITTLEEKSLGCINKIGTRPLTACLSYGEQIRTKGSMYMESACFDPASITAKVAGGCQLILFTTGLGNPIGSVIAPVIKVTGNRQTYEFLKDMIDFDTSATLTGEKTVAKMADELMDLMMGVCSGEQVKAEINNAGVISIDQHHMLG